MKKLLYTAIGCILICGFHLNTKAHNAPGYMGKKGLLTYNLGFLPGMDYNYQPTITDAHYLQYTRAFTRNKAFEISYIHYGIKHDIDRYYNAFNYEGSSSSYYELTNIYGAYKISGNDLGISLKFYNKNWIAPIGKYHQLGVRLMNYTITDNYTYMKKVNFFGFEENIKLEPETKNKQSLGIVYGYGSSRIVNNKFVIDYGFQYNFIVSTLYPADEPYNIITEDELFRKSSNRRIFYNQMFKLKIGIGLVI